MDGTKSDNADETKMKEALSHLRSLLYTPIAPFKPFSESQLIDQPDLQALIDGKCHFNELHSNVCPFCREACSVTIFAQLILVKEFFSTFFIKFEIVFCIHLETF